ELSDVYISVVTKRSFSKESKATFKMQLDKFKVISVYTLT
ncbi:MAG: hypothetical protein ACI8R0_001284, partial [Alteromonadales bacterium]